MSSNMHEYSATYSGRQIAALWVMAPTETGTKRVLPDGCVDVILSVVDGRLDRLFVGPLTTAAAIPVCSGEVSVGVRFAPGTSLRALAAPLHTMRDLTLPLTDMHSRQLRLAPPVSALGSAENMLDYIDQWALGLAHNGGLRYDPLVDRVLAALDDRPNASMQDIYTALGVNSRAVQRRFLDLLGVSPKFYARTRRHQRASERLLAQHHPALATLALDLGFADQAHFVHDFTAFAGISPLKYRQEALTGA